MQQDDLFSCPDPAAEVIARAYYHKIGESQFADERRLVHVQKSGTGYREIPVVWKSCDLTASNWPKVHKKSPGNAGALCPIRKMIRTRASDLMNAPIVMRRFCQPIPCWRPRRPARYFLLGHWRSGLHWLGYWGLLFSRKID